MNETLMDQCRREAYEKVVTPQMPNDVEYIEAMTEDYRAGYALAMYAERSKRPPTVQQVIDAAVEVFGLGAEDQDDVLRFGMKLQEMPQTSLSVDEIVEIVKGSRVGVFKKRTWLVQAEVLHARLTDRLTAAATNNTTSDNEAR